jgi:hypothetical protein
MLLVALCAPVLLLAAPVRRAEAKPILGIGEQKPGMFGDPRFERLGLRHVRYLTPWDTIHDPVALDRLDRWMAAARRHRSHVLLGFAHSLRSERLARTLPTRRRFRREFRRIRARYPDVRAFIVWSEANHPGALTWKRPRRAAKFFDVVANNCRGCQIVAADVLDVGNMASWVQRFKRAAHHRPRIWGIHNYGDANGLDSEGTRTLLSITRGRIWFTETGGLVLRRQYRGERVLATYRYSLRHAAEATRHVLRLSCLSRRIRRIYLYHWQAPLLVTNWDSALLGPRGRVRPAYWALRKWQLRGSCRRRPRAP